MAPNSGETRVSWYFCPEQCKSTDPQEKSKHTLRHCNVCREKHESLSQSFPMHRMKAQTSPQISFSPDDMTSPSQFGSKMLKDANSISENYSQKSIQQVLEETPRARLVRRPDSRRPKARQQTAPIQQTTDFAWDQESDPNRHEFWGWHFGTTKQTWLE